MQLRVVDFNYLFQDQTALAASSADSEFPVSNLSKANRSKVHRTTGNFVIDATNNKIDLKDASGGSQLTATIAAGTYTPATLAAAVKAALEAASAHTYTVTFSSTTGLWTIATNGTFLSLLWSSGTNVVVSAGPSLGFSALADQTGATSYTGANIAIHTEEWVQIDLGSTESIDSLALLFDSTRGIPLTTSAQLWIQANATPTWSSPAVSQALTIDTVFDAATFFWTVAQNYRYWRYKVKDPANPLLYAETPKIILGRATQFGQLPSNGFSFELDDQSKVSRTPYGHEYVDIYPQMRKLGIDLAALSYADAKALQTLYQRLGTTQPALFALDPLEDSFDKEHFLVYGKIGTKLQLKHLVGTYFANQLTITEVM